MNGAQAIARILKQEGIENLSCFPSNPIIEAAAAEGIRPIICRQERAGVNIADGFSRVSNGRRIGVFAMQYGPGAENAYGGVAQAFADSVPILLLPAGYPRDRADTSPNFGAALNYAGVTKWAGQVNSAARIPEMMRRAFSHLRTGRPGPVLLEVPGDVSAEEVDEAALNAPTVAAVRSAGDPHDVAEAARALIGAKRPVIHAGQGILYAEATDDLRELAELLQAPVMTTLAGKSAFPEDHPLSLGTGSNTTTGMVHHFLQKADTVFGIGCSFTQTTFGVTIPPGKVMVHSTNDPADVNKDYRIDVAVVGDAKLVLRQVIDEVKRQAGAGVPREDPTPAREIAAVKAEWLQGWMPRLTSDDTPINPYRVVWDLMHTIDRRNSIVTHDSGSPRDQTIPFYEAPTPRSYLGWGKSTQLGYGLGLSIGAKLGAPEKLVVNIMGDAAFGMAGLDVETAARCRLPILTILLNNSTMGGYGARMPLATAQYGAAHLSGDYAAVAEGLGAYSERVEQPAEIVPAIRRAQKAMESGRPALLEFITAEERTVSEFV